MSIVFYLNIVKAFDVYSYFRLNIFDKRLDFPLFTVYEVPKLHIIQHFL